MTTTARHMVAERATAAQSAQPQARAKSFGSRDDLLKGRTLKTTDVEIEGKLYRVRELMQGEIEEIAAFLDVEVQLPDIVVKRTMPDGTTEEETKPGSVEKRTNSRGFKTRTVAFALVDEHGKQLFDQPRTDWELLGDSVTPDVISKLFDAVAAFSAQTIEARADLGKDSEQAAS